MTIFAVAPTVAQLIEALQEYPADFLVAIREGESFPPILAVDRLEDNKVVVVNSCSIWKPE